MAKNEPYDIVDWKTLGIMAAVFVAMLSGSGVAVVVSFRLGAESEHIDINSMRIDRLEEFQRIVLQHDADTGARETFTEKRLDRLEEKDGTKD